MGARPLSGQEVGSAGLGASKRVESRRLEELRVDSESRRLEREHKLLVEHRARTRASILTHPPPHPFTHPVNCSPIHPLTLSLTLSLSLSLSLTHTHTHTRTLTLIHSHSLSLTLSLTRSLTHSLTRTFCPLEQSLHQLEYVDRA